MTCRGVFRGAFQRSQLSVDDATSRSDEDALDFVGIFINGVQDTQGRLGTHKKTNSMKCCRRRHLREFVSKKGKLKGRLGSVRTHFVAAYLF